MVIIILALLVRTTTQSINQSINQSVNKVSWARPLTLFFPDLLREYKCQVVQFGIAVGIYTSEPGKRLLRQALEFWNKARLGFIW